MSNLNTIALDYSMQSTEKGESNGPTSKTEGIPLLLPSNFTAGALRHSLPFPLGIPPAPALMGNMLYPLPWMTGFPSLPNPQALQPSLKRECSETQDQDVQMKESKEAQIVGTRAEDQTAETFDSSNRAISFLPEETSQQKVKTLKHNSVRRKQMFVEVILVEPKALEKLRNLSRENDKTEHLGHNENTAKVENVKSDLNGNKASMKPCILQVPDPVSGEMRFECPGCRKLFSTQEEILVHWDKEHIDPDMTCRFCGYKASQISNLKRHMQNHLSAGRFTCPTCKKGFMFMCNLRRHMVSHTNYRSFACDICNKAFKLKQHLKQHKHQAHSDERPYTCHFCNMSFRFIDNRTVHIRKVHTGERPYHCPHCEQRFISRDQRKAHISRMHAESTFSCPDCQQRFATKSSLAHHVKRRHQVQPSQELYSMTV